MAAGARPALLLLLLARLAEAVVVWDSVALSNPTAYGTVEGFGMAEGGEIRLEWQVPGDNAVVLSVFGREQVEDYAETYRDDLGTYGSRLCEAPSAIREEMTGVGNATFVIAEANQYSVFVLYCLDAAEPGEDLVIRSELINPNVDGELSQHAPIELASLEAGFGVLCTSYAALLIALVADLWTYRLHVRSVQLIGGVVLGLKAVEMASWRRYYGILSREGTVGVERTAGSQMLTCMSNELLLLFFLLLSRGWSILLPRLSPNVRRFSLLAFVAYSIAAWSNARCEAEDTKGTPNDCEGDAIVEYAIKSLVMLGILISLNQTVQGLVTRCGTGAWSPQVLDAYFNLARYRRVYWPILGYYVLSPMISASQGYALGWRYDWVFMIANEFVTMGAVLCVGLQFRPQESCARAFFGG